MGAMEKRFGDAATAVPGTEPEIAKSVRKRGEFAFVGTPHFCTTRASVAGRTDKHRLVMEAGHHSLDVLAVKSIEIPLNQFLFTRHLTYLHCSQFRLLSLPSRSRPPGPIGRWEPRVSRFDLVPPLSLNYELDELVPRARHFSWKRAEEPAFVLAKIDKCFGMLLSRGELQAGYAIDLFLRAALAAYDFMQLPAVPAVPARKDFSAHLVLAREVAVNRRFPHAGGAGDLPHAGSVDT